MPADKYSYVSSRLVREVAQAGGPVRGLVPDVVEFKLRQKLDAANRLEEGRLEKEAAKHKAKRGKRKQ
jgi:pantetheine-phosphate adenylyltransferase